MTTPDEYRELADKCLRWAAGAETEELRRDFLEMARYWTSTALRLDRMLTPDADNKTLGIVP